MDNSGTNEHLLQRIEELSLRMSEMQQGFDELTRRMDNLVGAVAQIKSSPAPAASANGSHPAPPEIEAAPPEEPAALEQPEAEAPVQRSLVISPGLAAVIRQIALGQGEEAHRAMRELPGEELKEQPAVVALVAAALCVQRGDFTSGLTALQKARSLTDDPRLLRVMQAVEAQIVK